MHSHYLSITLFLVVIVDLSPRKSCAPPWSPNRRSKCGRACIRTSPEQRFFNAENDSLKKFKCKVWTSPLLRQIIGPLGISFEDENGTAPDSICCLIELPITRARRRQKDDHARLNIQKVNHSELSVTSQFSSMHFFT